MALTGALLLTSAPTASADYIRDKQWVIDVMNFKKVWSESEGQGVTVAVVDTGVDGSHPDLTGQVLEGKDFTGKGGGVHSDFTGHGTGMASLIAGHGHGADGSSGVIGLARKAKILPVRAGTGNEFDDNQWAQGVRYAVDHGASVINLSFGDSLARPGSEGAKAIKYAQEHDAVVVASAGNDGAGQLEYPAKLPGVISVGAVDNNLTLWENSNYGTGLTLTAPGVKLVQADPTESSGYAEGTGTSDATAYVSATAALIRAKYPNLTAGQVINRLIKSATFLNHDVKKAPDEEYGYGIIRPYKALTMDIPAGPKEGPLAQASPSTSTNSGTASGDNDSTSKVKKKKKSSSGSIFLIAGVAGVVVVGAILFAVIRSRRNRGSGGPGSGGGIPPQGTGYPPQHPTYPPAQQPYQSQQHPSPYTQQPPHQGQ
ncbi:type VII secretion-associated serine protease mycosin [Streptomyces glomeratus]|uniref:type VII secretion-associated serine protease mycosin n=1 Tax=Streptomyces glomeratus TaxID=284452 RepID=UPI001F2BC4F1|nr:type VII secretion-associated serine protease mycosin [Streptomyces glomeratus]MCF1511524.1 type VII secretion-associated serine protease mycosin [Streptomyces glomeratus]